MAGAATAITHPAMQRMYREMARYRTQRTAFIDGKRAYTRSLFDALPAGEEHPLKPPARTDHDCFVLCGNCGYLAEIANGRCPGCGQTEWLDLHEHDIADRIRDREQADRLRIPRIQDIIAVSLLVIATIAAYFAFGGFAWWITLAGAAVGVALYLFLRRPLAWLIRWLSPKRPIRWRMPTASRRLGSKPDKTVRGPAGSRELLAAPFTGRKCLAYKASVLFDTAGDARPPEWVLAEVAAVDFALRGLDVKGDRVLVDVPVEPVELEAGANPDLDLDEYLRSRGLFLDDGEFELFEARIEPDRDIEARFYDWVDIVSVTTED